TRMALLNPLQFDRLVMQMAVDNADNRIIPTLLNYYERQPVYIPKAAHCPGLIRVYAWLDDPAQDAQREALKDQLAHLPANQFEFLMTQMSAVVPDDRMIPVLLDYYRRQNIYI